MKLPKQSPGLLAVLNYLLEKFFDKVNRLKNVSVELPSFLPNSENWKNFIWSTFTDRDLGGKKYVWERGSTEIINFRMWEQI